MYIAPTWIERHCVVPDGINAGAPFLLYNSYQLPYIAGFYTVRGDAIYSPGIGAPAFLYRRALLVGPQKIGKNPLVATQICLEGIGPALFAGFAGRDEGYACADHGCGCGWEYAYKIGEPMGTGWATPLIQVTAFSEDSTANTWDALRPMIELGPLAAVITKTGEEFIRLPHPGDSRIETVTSSAPSRLGQKTTFVPQDEVGLYTVENKMARVADTQYRNLSGMSGRAALTTNSWDPAENSVAQQQYESPATDILRMFTQPPRTLSYTDRRDRRKIHRIVYPPDVRRENGGHLDLEAIENEAADLVERDAPQAMRFYGNILVAGAGHAVDPLRWDALARSPGEKPPDGSRIGAGFDGSITMDATLIRGCHEGRSFLWKAWERPTGPELRRWLAGHPGKDRWEVDRLEVEAAVDELFATYDVGLLLCDTPKWRTEIERWTEKFKLGDRPEDQRVLAFDTNQARRFAPAVDRWLTGIATGEHTHDADPITDAHVKAAHRQKVRLADHDDDGRTLYVLVKGADKRRIDGAITDVLAFQAEAMMPESVEVASIYEREKVGATFVDWED